MILSIEIVSVGLLIKSYGTLTFIKPGVILYYHKNKNQLAVNIHLR